ncbi:MAG: hypothetical protein K8E66_06385 [Phycisphaerales bacterium]|nr:hypothetical protein [Phycisphaerales bacterium]
MTTTARSPRPVGRVVLSELSNEELFVVSVFATPGEREAIQAELEKRATRCEVRRILSRSPMPRQTGRHRSPCPA